MLPGPAPAAASARAHIRAHSRRSARVYPTSVGRPPVPLEPCRATTSDRGTANIPNG